MFLLLGAGEKWSFDHQKGSSLVLFLPSMPEAIIAEGFSFGALLYLGKNGEGERHMGGREMDRYIGRKKIISLIQ